MKIFKVKASKYSYCADISYCNFISDVVVAESEERALEITIEKDYDVNGVYWDLNKSQYSSFITDIEVEQVIN